MAHAQDAAALKARHTDLRDALSSNVFQRPLVLESSERSDSLKGDILARIDQPFAVVGPALQGGERWCDGGTRGVIERNTMRYDLAIEAYLGALSLPPAQQLDKRLDSWHSGVERYPRQLRELERSEYVAMKREQVRTQQRPGG